MIRANNEALIGYGSDYPYFWLKRLPEGKETLPTHIAFDAPSKDASASRSKKPTNSVSQALKLWINFTS